MKKKVDISLVAITTAPGQTALWGFSCWFLRSTKMEATKPM